MAVRQIMSAPKVRDAEKLRRAVATLEVQIRAEALPAREAAERELEEALLAELGGTDSQRVTKARKALTDARDTVEDLQRSLRGLRERLTLAEQREAAEERARRWDRSDAIAAQRREAAQRATQAIAEFGAAWDEMRRLGAAMWETVPERPSALPTALSPSVLGAEALAQISVATNGAIRHGLMASLAELEKRPNLVALHDSAAAVLLQSRPEMQPEPPSAA